MRMATVVISIELILNLSGFVENRNGIFLREVVANNLSHWAVVTKDKNRILISIGAVSAWVNKFAFRVLRKASQGRFKPQFPAYAGPPIFIAISSNIENDEPDTCYDTIARFDAEFGSYSLNDWFELAIDRMPYAPAQSIIIPAYLLLKNDYKRLHSYLSHSRLANPTDDVIRYFAQLRKLAEEAPCPGESKRMVK
jgi:hypothetical protein